jgi:hypothetical protein
MLSRLSGSTAEFLSIWNLMMAGHHPFLLSDTDLSSKERNNSSNGQCAVLGLRPILPAWLFDQQTKSLSFVFLGSIKVTYRNPQLIDTWQATHFSGIAHTKDGLKSFLTSFDHTIAPPPSPASSTDKSPSSLRGGGHLTGEYFDCYIAELARSGGIGSIEVTVV